MSHVKTMGLASPMGILTSARVPQHLLVQTVKVNIQGYAYTLYRNSSLFIGTYPNHFPDGRGAASLRYRNRTEITVVRER